MDFGVENNNLFAPVSGFGVSNISGPEFFWIPGNRNRAHKIKFAACHRMLLLYGTVNEPTVCTVGWSHLSLLTVDC